MQSVLPWAPVSLWVVRFAVLALLAAICLADIRERRIPNRLVLAGLGLAMVWQAFGVEGAGLFASDGAGAIGFARALAGAVAGFAAFFVLHLVRVMGAGDVKLVAFLGAVFGLAALPLFLLSVFAVGGLLVAFRLLDGERRRRVVGNLRLIFLGASAGLSGTPGPQFDPRADTADRLPFGVAIVGGALVVASLQWFGWPR